MQIIDYIILGLMAIGLIIGLCKGFIKQLFGLGSIVLAFFLAGMFAGKIGGLMSGLIADENISYIVAYIICVIVVLIVVGLIGKKLNKLFSRAKILGTVNRLLGAALGLAIVYVIFSVAVPLVNIELESGLLNNLLGLLRTQFGKSTVLTKIYASNPVGDYLISLIFKA